MKTMPGVHRNTDARSCGAETTVSLQSTVYANDKLVAVHGDPNSHGDGGLIASGSTVFVEDKLIIIEGDSANPDAFCPILPIHCNPSAVGKSDTVFIY